MHILLFLLIILIVIIVFGLSIVGAVLRAIFGFGRSNSTSRPRATGYERTNQQQSSSNPNNDTYTSYDNTGDTSSDNPSKAHKKIFSKDEGEYVDFEEMK